MQDEQKIRAQHRLFLVLFFLLSSFIVLYWVISQLTFPSDHPELPAPIPFTADAEVTYADGTRESVTIPGSFPIHEGTHVAAVSFHLPEQFGDSNCLVIANRDVNLTLTSGGQTLLQYTAEKTQPVGKYAPFSYLFVHIPRNCWGKEAVFTIHTPDDAVAPVIGEMFYGRRYILVMNLLHDQLPEIIAAAILLMACIVSLCFSIHYSIRGRRILPLLYLSIATGLIAIWALANSPARQIFFPNYSAIRDVAFMVVAFIPAPFLFYLNCLQKGRHRKLLHTTAIIVFLDFLAQIAAYFLKLQGWNQMFPISAALLTAVVLEYFFTLFWDIRKRHIHEYLLSAIGLIFPAVAAVFQAFIYLQRHNIGGLVAIAGLAVLLAFEITASIRNAHRMAIERDKALLDVNNISIQAMKALAKTVDAKSSYTANHSERVAKYSCMIAEKAGYDAEARRRLYYIALLHDVGKIGIPDEIINKPGKLTDEEYATIKTHPVIGADILKNIKIPGLYVGARWHHERYDGCGYPDGLLGTDIPEIARIIAVADAYDAMTSNRSYRGIIPQEKVRSEIEHNKGTQFDPTFANFMLEIIDSDPDYQYHG